MRRVKILLTVAGGSGMVCRRQIVTHFAAIGRVHFDRYDRNQDNTTAAAPLTVGGAGRTVLCMSSVIRRTALRLHCPAKINLHLRVGPRRRADAFHPLLSWMVT